jgi:hypothetical protein
MSRSYTFSRSRAAASASRFNPRHQLPGPHNVQPQSKSSQALPAQLDISRIQQLDAGVMRTLHAQADLAIQTADSTTQSTEFITSPKLSTAATEQYSSLQPTATTQPQAAPVAVEGDLAADSSMPVVQREKPKITTPDELPDPPMAGEIPPPADEITYDAEGNEISQSRSGRWYLSALPEDLQVPVASGFDYRLLPINPNASYRELLNACRTIAKEQLAVSKGLKQANDMKYWFAKVYYYVTKFELEKVQNGDYQYPHMKMQEVIHFYNTYKTNLDNWEANNKAQVEENWKRAFSAAESMNDGSIWRTKSLEIMKSLLPSMEAHIRFDLPRAIAAVYGLHYSGIPGASLGDFKSDFFKMGEVFELANAALTEEIDADESVFRYLDPSSWNWAQDAGFPFIFHVGLEREMAWEKAEFVHQYRNLDPALANRYIRGNLNTAHPNLEPFEVDDEVVKNFDWFNQPGAEPDLPGPNPDFLPAPAVPAIPEKIFFKFDRPKPDDKLEHAVRDDQDLAPLLELAGWLKKVREATINLEGHASEEGKDYYNHNLGISRAFLIEDFLFHHNADITNNQIVLESRGEESAAKGPEWRYVKIEITGDFKAKQQFTPPNPNLPSEVNH